LRTAGRTGEGVRNLGYFSRLRAEQDHHHDARLDLALEFDHPFVVAGVLERGVALMHGLRAEAGERRVRVLDNHQLVVIVEE
jgi:hypothetical protein